MRKVYARALVIPAVAIATLSLAAQPAAQSAPNGKGDSVRSLSSRAFFEDCKKSGKFHENQFGYAPTTIMAGRCALSHFKGVKFVGSYAGHSPSADRALDIMVNMKGSCKAGRETGNQLAEHYMKYAKRYNVKYIIWKNSYWASYDKARPWKSWRHGMAGGSCTTRHFDHVHISFNR